MTDLVGQSVDRYHILEQLGGGMATVYKAYDTRLEREVAVKVIRTEKLTLETMPKSLKRFEREAKSLGKLTHPNIVPVSDYGEYEGKPYLVMPYLPGGTLKEKLGKPIPWQDAIQLLIPIAEALDYAHEQNMIHRDVKPANILLTQRGQPMLTDFGIAKILDLEETQDLTGTSAAIGTPEYMAPEQATAKTVDKRADIYSLGIVLYEMVTGRKPFVADTPMAVLIKQATEPLPRPIQFVPNLPDAVEKVLVKVLAKERDNRYQTMDEFVSALKGLLASRSAIKPKPASEVEQTIRETGTIKEIKPNTPSHIDLSSRPRRDYLPFITFGLILLCAFGIVGFILSGRNFSPIAYYSPVPNPTSTEAFKRYDVPTDGFYSIGPVDAPIVMVEFADFQCPYCQRWHQQVHEPLMAAYPGKIRIVYRNLPLTSIHPQSMPAAEAAMCAGEQNAFWQYHDKLFENSGSLSDILYSQLASDLGLQMDVFEACINNHKYQVDIKADMDFALALGVQSTPTFFINGLAIVGAQPLDAFKQLIDDELSRMKP